MTQGVPQGRAGALGIGLRAGLPPAVPHAPGALYGGRRLEAAAHRELSHSGAGDYVCVCDIPSPPPPPDAPMPPLQPGCEKILVHTTAHMMVMGEGFACQNEVPDESECQGYAQASSTTRVCESAR